MRPLLPLFILLCVFSGCRKESSDEEIYGYEVDCEHCNISYLDANEKYVSIQGQRKHWKIEFRPKFVFQLQVIANSVSVNSEQINVYILQNGSRVKTASGKGSVSTQYNASSSTSSKPASSSTLCGAPTQKGGTCKRKVNGGGRCWQHK